MTPPTAAAERLLAIDYGSRRLGLAVSEGTTAIPLGALERKDDRAAVRALIRLAEREAITGFILGEPRRLDGTRGEAAQKVSRFAERLRQESGLTVELVDETLTSVEAARRLRAGGYDPARHPERIDAVSAQILLEEALARRARARGGRGSP
ncbi:MAG: Holliday junction resolvase RuvX [Thermoanaerobaculia bacterium]|nr:Holliday junction resolvase RuvX [Thermoanaerobaculia bacterium]